MMVSYLVISNMLVVPLQGPRVLGLAGLGELPGQGVGLAPNGQGV